MDDNSFKTQLAQMVKEFNTSPYLFIGSGFSNRYLNTPDWKSLLTYFANLIKPHGFAFKEYSTIANNNYPLIGSLISNDYNKKWFNDLEFRNSQPTSIINYIEKEQCDPFHAAIAEYLKTFTTLNPTYKDEIESFKNILDNSINGIITTNYDNLLDSLAPNYSILIGQKDLLISQPVGIGEIYKIHGSYIKPESLIITKNDYNNFNNNAKYLSSKLITFFIENPIFFIGYSISDNNIKKIIEDILKCIPKADKQKIKTLEKNFFFVDYNETCTPHITKYTYSTELEFKNLTVNNYSIIFNALENHKNKIPVGIMRRFKKEFYEFTQKQTPNNTVKVYSINSDGISNQDYAIYIAPQEKIKSIKEFNSIINRDQIFIDIVLNNIKGDPNDILNNTILALGQNIKATPVYKYISLSTEPFPYEMILTEDRDTSLEKKLNNGKIKNIRSVSQIFMQKDFSLHQKINYCTYLGSEEINIEELEKELTDLLTKYPKIFTIIPDELKDNQYKTNLRKLIRIYDLIKYKSKAMKNLELIKSEKEEKIQPESVLNFEFETK